MLGVLIGVLAGVLLWLVFAPAGKRRRSNSMLEGETVEAEQEVRDLGAFTTAEEADDELPDWGPGVPKQRS